MKRLLFVHIIVLSFLAGNASAQNQAGARIGVKGALLFGCMSAGGLTLDLSMGKMFSLEMSGLYSNHDESNAVLDAMEEEDESTSYSVEAANFERSMAHVQLRIFPTTTVKSLNFALGVALSDLKASLVIKDEGDQDVVDEAYHFQQALWTISVGNLWTWKTFYVAADWVGTAQVSHNFSRKRESNSDEFNAVTQSGKDSFDDSFDHPGEIGGGIILAFTAGIWI